ncbi:MAG: LD-carboxypeptidase, partial [Oscillatoriales cyanobacterium SM2_2_1]|nr:LD-carboxypeptidase [Oscillatoriales cyanobacterium SM2_2_1]
MDWPVALCQGDRVAVILPSGAVREPDRLGRGLNLWRDRGFVVEMPDWQTASLDQPQPYLAGSDLWRQQELIRVWNEPEIRAIICGRGGYGAMRLLEGLNWQALTQEPKWLVGFSDVTALLWG